MQTEPKSRKRLAPLLRAVIEVGSIVFLFYSNLLMGEFTVTGEHGKTMAHAMRDIFTEANFLIGISTAMVGYLAFEYLRKKL